MTVDNHISDNFYSQLLNSFSGVFFKISHDKNKTILFVENNCENITGYSQNELLNYPTNTFNALIHESDALIFNDFIEKVSHSKFQLSVEYRILDRKGNTKRIKNIACSCFNDNGEFQFIESYIQDISSTIDLSTVSKLFSSLQNAINSASLVSLTDISGKIVYANQKFSEHSKYPLNELIAANHRIVNSGYHPKSFFENLWTTILKGKIWRNEICNKAKDGSIYWVDAIISPVFDKNNQIVQFFSIRNIITEKKIAETALLKSEERLRKVFDGVNDVIYTISKAGKFLTINNAFERLTGWPINYWVNKSFIDLIHPDDVELAVSVFKKVIQGSQVDGYELRIKTASGKYIYIESAPSALIENGQVISTLGIARDISFRKETELKLKHIFETISVKTGLNYFTTLTKFCCDNLNVKFAIIGSYSRQTNSITTISFRSSTEVFDNYTYSVKNEPCEKVINFERFVFLNSLQELFPENLMFKKHNICSYMAYPLNNDNGDVLGIIILMDDKIITDTPEKENLLSFVLARTANEIRRNNSEIELLRSQERYKAVVENMNDAITIRNIKGRIIYGNKRFLDLLGLKEEDLVNLNMNDLIAPSRQDEIRKQYLKIISGASTVEVYEYEALHKNGISLWLEDKTTLIYEDDKVTGTQSIIRDITELKKKENDLNKLIHELTNRNSEMMQFNYIVSHNLRAPIANIIGLSNLITDTNLSLDENKKVIEYIKASTTKIDEMIKDLSVVLSTKSNFNAKREKVYLKNIIFEITETLKEQLNISDCDLTIDINETANEQFTIKSYIESIIFNLLSNSIKYRSSKRQLTVDIKAQRIGSLTTLTIEDNGIGINLKENGEHVFGLYKRFNYDVEGKGLGLHMVKTQVEALGGKITLESQINKGSVFKIEFRS